jgi:hypothetical protein
MNDQRIFECLAQNGPSTDVELAIWLAVSADDIHGQMAALVAVGDVCRVPHGDGMAYQFSEGFKRSEVHAKIARRAAILKYQQDPATTTPAAKARHFLLANGRQCTSAEMHAALGLTSDELPSAVLADELAAGHLFKDGKHWFLDDRRAAPRELPAVAPAALDLPEIPRLLAPAAEAVRFWPIPEVASAIAKAAARDPSSGVLLPIEEPPVLRMTKRRDMTVLIKRGPDRMALSASDVAAIVRFAQENDIR